jgi:hypothetical protein
VPMLNDVTRCRGVDCHQKHLCARHITPIPDNILLSWVATLNPERAHMCPGFIADKLDE